MDGIAKAALRQKIKVTFAYAHRLPSWLLRLCCCIYQHVWVPIEATSWSCHHQQPHIYRMVTWDYKPSSGRRTCPCVFLPLLCLCVSESDSLFQRLGKHVCVNVEEARSFSGRTNKTICLFQISWKCSDTIISLHQEHRSLRTCRIRCDRRHIWRRSSLLFHERALSDSIQGGAGYNVFGSFLTKNLLFDFMSYSFIFWVILWRTSIQVLYIFVTVTKYASNSKHSSATDCDRHFSRNSMS